MNNSLKAGSSRERNSRFFKLWRRRTWLFFAKLSRADHRVGRPRKTTREEDLVISLWSRITHLEDSRLYYNPATHESMAYLPGQSIYMFLESGQMRVINTVVGYDVPLSSEVEQWCSQIFAREVHRRRTRFKDAALSKVVHSLEDLELRILREYESQNNTD
jgi:hypothetical protein